MDEDTILLKCSPHLKQTFTIKFFLFEHIRHAHPIGGSSLWTWREMSQPVSPQACSKLFSDPTAYSSVLKCSRHWQNLKKGLYNQISLGNAEVSWGIFHANMYWESPKGNKLCYENLMTKFFAQGAWLVFLELSVGKCWSRKITPKHFMLELKGSHHWTQPALPSLISAASRSKHLPSPGQYISRAQKAHLAKKNPSVLQPTWKALFLLLC